MGFLNICILFTLFYSGHFQHSFQDGTVPQIDDLIQDVYVLKALSFSVTYKDSVYKDVLDEVIQSIRDLKPQLKDGNEKEDADYYVYILENVKKYTIKWLTEEVHQFYIQSQEELKKDEINVRKKSISDFIYYTALEFGGQLVLDGKDTSLDGWKPKELEKAKRVEL